MSAIRWSAPRGDTSAFPAPNEGIVLPAFIVSNDIARSCRFYTDVLGGQLVTEREPSVMALANSWVIIKVGGGSSVTSRQWSSNHRTT
jgi:Glyoxalase/Bleomycin resistance protein/Dioxygenase superfamily